MPRYRLGILLITCLLLILWLGELSAQTADSTAARPDYPAKLKLLLKQEQAGISNPGLANQIGLAYYHQGQAGKAVLYFLRALRLDSSQAEAQNNLEYALSRSLDRDLYEAPGFLVSVFQRLFRLLSLNRLAILLLIFLALTVYCLSRLLLLKQGGDKNVPVLWLTMAGFAFLVFAVLLAFKYHSFLDDKTAVLIETQSEGFSGPGTTYGKLFTIHAGLIVHINRLDKDWALITLPNGAAGWVEAQTLERVKP